MCIYTYTHIFYIYIYKGKTLDTIRENKVNYWKVILSPHNTWVDGPLIRNNRGQKG